MDKLLDLKGVLEDLVGIKRTKITKITTNEDISNEAIKKWIADNAKNSQNAIKYLENEITISSKHINILKNSKRQQSRNVNIQEINTTNKSIEDKNTNMERYY